MSDWADTTQDLLEQEHMRTQFEDTLDYICAFEQWASEEYPELYGND